MAQVNVTINGKLYRMACEDGQEAYLEELAHRLSQTIERLRGEFGEIGDQRLTVMAAITLADQSSEHERRLQQFESEVHGLEAAHVAAAERHQLADAGLAQAIDSLAARLESVAAKLNGNARHDNGGG
jgi:cell division protein ZapA